MPKLSEKEVSKILKSCSPPLGYLLAIFSPPKILPLFLVSNGIIPVTERNIEVLSGVTVLNQNFLGTNVGNDIEIPIVVHKGHYRVVVGITSLVHNRVKCEEVNLFRSTELKPIGLHSIIYLIYIKILFTEIK